MMLYGKKTGDVTISEYAQDQYVEKFRALAEVHFHDFRHESYFAPANLSLFVGHFIRYMEKWAGQHSPKPRPFTRIPAECLRDFNREGSLVTIVKGCYDFMKKKAIPKIDLEDLSKTDLWNQMYIDVIRRLRARRLIKPKHIFFDLNLPFDETEELKKIARKHGANVVDSPFDKCTHVIVAGQSNVDEEDFIRPVHVDESLNIAYVHWWYYPDSYDEWISLAHVQGQSDRPQKPEGPFKVGTRWLRDTEKFNEWTNEYDYHSPDATFQDRSRPQKKK